MSVANDKGDNEMIPGVCTDLLAFALQLRKTPENLNSESFVFNDPHCDIYEWLGFLFT